MKKQYIPVIVGVSQCTQSKDMNFPLDPLELMERTSRNAFSESGAEGLLQQCDTIRVINIVSYPYADACRELGRSLRITPGRFLYGGIGSFSYSGKA